MADGKVSYQHGSLEAGLANGTKLLGTNPAAAALQARALLKAAPQDTAAHRLFARAMAALGHPEEARMARARAVQFSRHVPVIAEAHKAVLNGRPRETEALLRSHLAAFPDDPVALMVNGEALARMGRLNEAVANLEAALAFMPEYVEARVGLVRAHQHRVDLAAALEAIEPLLAQKPADSALPRWKASLLSNLERNAEAAAIYARLTEGEPESHELWIRLADERRTLGLGAQADAAYRRAVSVSPGFGRAWWGLAALGYAPLDSGDRAKIAAALAARPDPEDAYHLHFALGAALEQAGMRGEAFSHLAAGNDVRHRLTPYDPAKTQGEVADSRRYLTREFFAEHKDSGCPAADPIFIVGMPRSGSTLVEQVLGCHPEIEATAELPAIPALVRILGAEHGLGEGGSFAGLLPRIDPAALQAAGEEYLRLARQHRKTGKSYFLDKLPHNWADAGFIKLILPNAKIVDVRRSPMDCCWSNFRLLFARGHPSSNSLTGMAEYYRAYVAMMDHYDRAMPGAVHRAIYERLVDNFEPEVRRLLDYIGVPFDPACLDFHNTNRPVATASSEQVRQPLNRKGIGAWKAYEEWLGPLKDAVGDLERTYAG